MGFNNKYPYTDFHEFNLDWVINKVKNLETRVTTLETWKTTIDTWKSSIDSWKTGIDTWKSGIDSWKTGINTWKTGIDNWKTTIDTWKTSISSTVSGHTSDIAALQTGKQDKLIASSNIQIAADGKTISATDTTYTAGTNITISPSNVISATDTIYTLPIASDSNLGGIKVGEHLTIEADGTLNAEAGGYTLPIAGASTLGGVKVGNNLSIDADGVLSATGGGSGAFIATFTTDFENYTFTCDKTVNEILTASNNKIPIIAYISDFNIENESHYPFYLTSLEYGEEDSDYTLETVFTNLTEEINTSMRFIFDYTEGITSNTFVYNTFTPGEQILYYSTMGLLVPGTVNSSYVDADGYLTATGDSGSFTNWNITNMDLSAFTKIRFYFYRDESNTGGTWFCDVPLYREIQNGGTPGNGFYVSSGQMASFGDRNRFNIVQCGVKGDLSSIAIAQTYSLYGNIATTISSIKVFQITGIK